jgi:hypothetical protein
MKTYGELLESLIGYYEEGIRGLPSSYGRRFEYLEDKHINMGVCYCCKQQYRLNIYRSDFIKEFTEGRMVYCDIPASRMLKKPVAGLLQKRIDRMRELFDKWKDVKIEEEWKLYFYKF